MSNEEMEACWEQMAGDPVKAWVAAYEMIEAGPRALAFLQEKVKPKKNKDITELLKQLDDDEYEVREAATVKLAGLRPEIDQQLKRALKESKSFEVTMRLERILDDGKSSRPVEATRTTRAEWAMTRLKQMIDDESAAKNDKP